MTLTTIQLVGIDLEGFKSIIGNVVATVLQENKTLFSNNEKGESDKYLSRQEAAEFLKISKTTLWSLDKTQVLPARRLNGKVLYLKSDLLNFNNQTA